MDFWITLPWKETSSIWYRVEVSLVCQAVSLDTPCAHVGRGRLVGSLAETSKQVSSPVIASSRFMATTIPGTSSWSTHATYVVVCSARPLLCYYALHHLIQSVAPPPLPPPGLETAADRFTRTSELSTS